MGKIKELGNIIGGLAGSDRGKKVKEGQKKSGRAGAIDRSSNNNQAGKLDAIRFKLDTTKQKLPMGSERVPKCDAANGGVKPNGETRI